MDRIPRTGEVYRDREGNLWRVVTLASHAGTGEKLVVCQALSGETSGGAGNGGAAGTAGGIAGETSGGAVLPLAVPLEGFAERLEQAEGTSPDGVVSLDPGLGAFLDADGYEKKLEVLFSLRGRLNASVLNAMALSLDLELTGGSAEEQYEELKNCLQTLKRYECNRLR